MTDISSNSQKSADEESFDTKGLLLSFLSNWKWFVLSIVVCLAIGVLRIKSTVPLYSVTASLYINNSNDVSGMSMDNANPLLAMKNFLDETELEILKSRNNIIKVVDSLNLYYSYSLKGMFRPTPLYHNEPVIASLDSTSLANLRGPINVSVKPVDDGKVNIKVETRVDETVEKKSFKNLTLPCEIELSHATLTLTRSPYVEDFDRTELISISSGRAVATSIHNGIIVEFAKNSEQIANISFTTPVPQKGIDIVNALVEEYNEGIIEDKNRAAVQTENFILERLVGVTDELSDVETRLQNYRQAHNITDVAAQSQLNLTLRSNYQNQLAEAETELSQLNTVEQMVSDASSYAPLPQVINNAGLSSAIQLYNTRVTQMNRALEGTTPNHPMVGSMRESLNLQKQSILQSIHTAKRTVQERISNIRSLENQSEGALASAPTVDKGLQEIFREQQVKVNIYTFLLQRREELALQKTLATSRARLIDNPCADAPIAPRTSMILLLSIVLGFAIPAGVIFMRRTLFPSFSNQDELERLTNVPVLGEISISEKGHKDAIVVADKVDTPIAELFRLMRNNISFAHKAGDNNLILITSAISGEGKSFIATNLAASYAITGKKVLVIGSDIRRPVLALTFGIDNRRGLTNYLSGKEKDLNSLIIQTSFNPNLYVLPAGPVAPNPNELFLSDNMKTLMKTVSEEYDYVIIDSAPIGVISDTYLVAPYASIQIYVMRADYSTMGSLKTLHHAVAHKHLTRPFIILNGVNMASSTYMYGRYGTFGIYKKRSYGYGYANHSTHDKKD